MTDPQPLAETGQGTVQGQWTAHGALYRGIPYAASPVGALRFEAPRPPRSWRGVRDATSEGPGAVQPWRDGDPWDRYFNPRRQSLDCLTLQVHAPADAHNAPVMVWIHGGAFMTGVGSAPAHRGETWVRDGIVHVAVNYRTAIDGFTLLEDSIDADADNLGLRDQVAALHWVRTNIEAFGGNPADVTIMGQSAGAISVAFLMASPLATGLFHRAVVESGMPNTSLDIETALDKARGVARHARRTPTREAMRSLTEDETRRAMSATYNDALANAGVDAMLPFSAAHGTPSLPMPVTDALALGYSSGVPLLIGTTADEMAGILLQLGQGATGGATSDGLLHQLGLSDADLHHYQEARGSSSPLVALSGLLTDALWRRPSIEMACAHQGSSYVYEFTWQSPLLPAGVGADHTFDIPFVQDDFDTVVETSSLGQEMLGAAPPAKLATAMHSAFARFITGGDPGWPRYDDSDRTTMRFDVDSQILTGHAIGTEQVTR